MKCIDGNFYVELEKIWSESPATRTKWFTALDLGYIDAWLEDGVPEWAIVMGIRQTLEKFKPKFRGDRVRSISYCQDEIYKACDTHADRIVDEWWAERRREDAERAQRNLSGHPGGV